MSGLTCFLTAPKGRECQTAEKALHDWHEGELWDVYLADGTQVTIKDVPGIKAAGYTRVILVYQDKDLRPQGLFVEL